MDMAAKFQDQTVFHMTGKRAGDGLAALTADFRPALLAPYRDLTRLRYDYPVVLLEAELAPRGIEGERLRKQLLRLERELRVLIADGATGTLTGLWPEAAKRAAGRDDGVRDVLTRAASALAVDGEVIDCSRALTERFVTRAWRNVNAEKARAFRLLVDHLIRKLTDILRAAFVHSQAGQQPQALKSGFGNLHGDVFDFPPPGIPDRGGFVEELTLVPQPLYPYEIWQAITSPPTLEQVPRAGWGGVFWNCHHSFIKMRWERFAEVLDEAQP